MSTSSVSYVYKSTRTAETAIGTGEKLIFKGCGKDLVYLEIVTVLRYRSTVIWSQWRIDSKFLFVP